MKIFERFVMAGTGENFGVGRRVLISSRIMAFMAFLVFGALGINGVGLSNQAHAAGASDVVVRFMVELNIADGSLANILDKDGERLLGVSPRDADRIMLNPHLLGISMEGVVSVPGRDVFNHNCPQQHAHLIYDAMHFCIPL